MEPLPNLVENDKPEQTQVESQHFFAVVALLFLCLIIAGAFLFWRRKIAAPSRQKQEVQTAIQQVKEGQPVWGFPLSKGQNGLYNFFVTLDNEVQLETPFELSTGETIPTLAKVYYFDAQGNQQLLNLPFFTYNSQDFTWHILDGETGKKENASLE